MGLLKKLRVLCLGYLKGGNYIRVIGDGCLKISSGVKLEKSTIIVYPGTKLSIGDRCNIVRSTISIASGKVELGENVILEKTNLNVDNGEMAVDHHSKVACKRVWIRFGGKLSIGTYTNINGGSEIRCDESVEIGSYNMISYNVRIWDTNTHSQLSVTERRQVTVGKYPYFGYEEVKPITSPVSIGDDCWIGENAAILKGSSIGKRCTVGFGTFISGKTIPDDCTAVNERILRIVHKIHK